MAKTILKKKKNVKRITQLDVKPCYIAKVIKIGWYLWRDRHTDRQNRIENPEIDLYECVQMNFDNDAKAIQWQKRQPFQQTML